MTSKRTQPDARQQDQQRYLELAREIVLSHLRDIDCRVFLYGSRASGQASGRSDIDIGFLCDRPLDEKRLMAIRHSLEESIVPFPVDLTDFTAVKDEVFKRQALEEAVIWK